MKICHIITRLILGGAQENTLLTCEGLAARGHEVTLITGPAIGPEGSLMDRARAGGYRVIECKHLRRAINPVRDLLAYRSLAKTLAAIAPDIVHTHSSKAGILGRRAAARATDARIVHTIHGLAFGPTQAWWKNALVIAAERRAARATDAFISVADAMTAQAVAAGIGPSGKFTTIYSGVLTGPFYPAAASDAPASPNSSAAGPQRSGPVPAGAHVVVTQISRLAKRKGHEFLLAAAEAMRDEPIEFHFVGDGALRHTIEREIARRGLTDVKLVGLVPPEMIPPILRASDILVHCSLREGLARAIPQAMLCGKPVVSFDVDGAREVVTPATGRLVPVRDVPALVTALRELAADSPLRRTLGDAGRSLAIRRFDHDHMIDQIAALYQRLMTKDSLTP